MQLRGDVQRLAWCIRSGLSLQPPVPGCAGFERGIMRGVQPYLASAPAKAGDGRVLDVAAVAACPGQGGVQIRHYLIVRHLADQAADQFADAGDLARVALAEIELGGHGQVAGFGQPSAQVADVFMHAEDFLHHQHHRQRAAGSGGLCHIARHDGGAGRDFHRPGVEAVAVGENGAGGYGLHRQREAHAHRAVQKVPTRSVDMSVACHKGILQQGDSDWVNQLNAVDIA